MEPLERSISHGTDTESVDTVQSLGPALIGNISVDSLDDHSSSPLNQQSMQHSLEPIIEPEPRLELKQALEDQLQVESTDSQANDEELKRKEVEGTGQKIDDESEQRSNQSVQQNQSDRAPEKVEIAEDLKDDFMKQGDDEDKEREQGHKDEEHQLFTLNQPNRMSISDEISEVQIQGTEREKKKEEEEELAHQLNKEREGEKEEDKKEEKVGSAEQKVEFIEEDLKQGSLVHEQESEQEQEQEQKQKQKKTEDQQQPSQLGDTSISLIKLHDISNNDLFHHTFKTAANTSQISQQFGDELEEDKNSIMEFAKNYSDDLISNELHRATSGEQNNDTSGANGGGGSDLADFELPPHSGSSSSASDQAAGTKHSPAKQRKSSNTMAAQASSSSYQAPGSSAPAVATDLSAVKNVLKSTYSRFSHVFQWKRPIESGIIFGIGLTLIIALTFFSIISVVAYTALGVICASGLLRIYKSGMKALSRSTETPVDHIWDRALSLNVSLSPERLHELLDTSHANINASMVYFKQVLLVEDKLATLKFALFLYSLTYIGAWFNGLTLITLIYLALFSAPILYENNKSKIDEYANLATKQISSSISMVTDRVGSVLGSQMGGGAKKQN